MFSYIMPKFQAFNSSSKSHFAGVRILSCLKIEENDLIPYIDQLHNLSSELFIFSSKVSFIKFSLFCTSSLSLVSL